MTSSPRRQNDRPHRRSLHGGRRDAVTVSVPASSLDRPARRLGATTFGYGYESKPWLGVIIMFAVGAFMTGTTLMSLWAVRIVDELDDGRHAEAQPKVAEERLQFARDLHDVVGRSFSAIAVKSELAARLARDPNRIDAAVTEMDGVKARELGWI